MFVQLSDSLLNTNYIIRTRALYNDDGDPSSYRVYLEDGTTIDISERDHRTLVDALTRVDEYEEGSEDENEEGDDDEKENDEDEEGDE